MHHHHHIPRKNYVNTHVHILRMGTCIEVLKDNLCGKLANLRQRFEATELSSGCLSELKVPPWRRAVKFE